MNCNYCGCEIADYLLVCHRCLLNKWDNSEKLSKDWLSNMVKFNPDREDGNNGK